MVFGFDPVAGYTGLLTGKKAAVHLHRRHLRPGTGAGVRRGLPDAVLPGLAELGRYHRRGRGAFRPNMATADAEAGREQASGRPGSSPRRSSRRPAERSQRPVEPAGHLAQSALGGGGDVAAPGRRGSRARRRRPRPRRPGQAADGGGADPRHLVGAAPVQRRRGRTDLVRPRDLGAHLADPPRLVGRGRATTPARPAGGRRAAARGRPTPAASSRGRGRWPPSRPSSGHRSSRGPAASGSVQSPPPSRATHQSTTASAPTRRDQSARRPARPAGRPARRPSGARATGVPVR